MPIKAVLEAIYSKRDRNGNCYWAFRYIDTATGNQVVGTISGGESNVAAIRRVMGLDSQTCHYIVTEMPIREFNRLTKTWAYAGCPPEALADLHSGLSQRTKLKIYVDMSARCSLYWYA